MRCFVRKATAINVSDSAESKVVMAPPVGGSPEKGFDVLIDAAAEICKSRPGVGFILFGDGPMRRALAAQIKNCGLEGRFLLAGFSQELDHYLPHFDIFARVFLH